MGRPADTPPTPSQAPDGADAVGRHGFDRLFHLVGKIAEEVDLCKLLQITDGEDIVAETDFTQNVVAVFEEKRQRTIALRTLVEQCHKEVCRNDEFSLDGCQHPSVLDGASLDDEEGVGGRQLCRPLAQAVFHDDPHAGVVPAGVEVVILGMDVGVVEGLPVGFLRILAVGRRTDMAAREARPAIHGVGVGEAGGHGQVGIFLKKSVVTGIARIAFVHPVGTPPLGFLHHVPFDGIVHAIRIEFVGSLLDKHNGIFITQPGELRAAVFGTDKEVGIDIGCFRRRTGRLFVGGLAAAGTRREKEREHEQR